MSIIIYFLGFTGAWISLAEGPEELTWWQTIVLSAIWPIVIVAYLFDKAQEK